MVTFLYCTGEENSKAEEPKGDQAKAEPEPEVSVLLSLIN